MSAFNSIASRAKAFLGIGLLALLVSACDGPLGASTDPLGYNPGVNFSLSTSTVTVSSTQVSPNVSTVVTVNLEDANGQPYISDLAVVTLQTTGGTSRGVFGAVTNAGNGSYSAFFTGGNVGTATTIEAFINGAPITTALPRITVVPGIYSLSNSLVTVSANTVASGSNIVANLIVKDSSGNQNTTGGLSVSFMTSGGTSTGSFGVTADNGDGTYSATFTGGIGGTPTSVTALIQGNAVTSLSPTVTVTGGVVSGISVNSGNNLSSAAGTPIGSPLVAITKDSNNLPIAGVSVSWMVTSGGGSLSACTSLSNSSGLVQCTLTTGPMVGGNMVTASVAGIATPATFTETGTVGSPAAISAVGSTNNQSATAGSALGSALQTVVTDASGNPVGAGIAVTWTTTTGGSIAACSASTTNASGIASCTPTLSATAGSNAFAASISGGGTAASFVATGVASSTIGSIVWGTAPNLSYTASNSSAMTTFTAILKDSNGNTITANNSTTVTASITSGSGALSGTTTVTAVNGVATFSAVKDTTASTVTIQAKENTANNVVVQSNVVVSPAAFSLPQSIVSSASSVASGSSITVTLTAKDAYGNSNPSGVTSVAFTSSSVGGTGSYGSVTNSGSGVYTASFTGVVAGSCTLGATINTSAVTSISSPSSITITASSTIASLVWGTSPSTTYTASGATPMTTFTAVLEDANGNTITSNSITTVTVSITSGTGPLGGTLTVTAASGIATFSSVTDVKASTITIQAKENTSNHPVSQPGIVVSPGSIASVAFTTGPSSSIGADTTQTIAVTEYDSNSNVITTDSSSGVSLVAYSTTNCAAPTVNSSLSATSGTVTSGVKTFTSFGIYKTSVQSILASIGSTTVCAGNLTVTPGAAASIAATSGGGQSANDGAAVTNPLVATVLDDHGNPTIAGTAVAWAVTSGNGLTSSCTTTTNGSGQVSCTFTNGTGKPSTTNTITATASGIATPATFTETGASVAFAHTWTFNSSSGLTYDSSKVDFTNGYAELTPASQTDNSNSCSVGFGDGVTPSCGGSSTGTAFSSTTDGLGSSNYMMLSHAGTATDLELDSTWTPAWSNLVGYWKLDETAGSTAVADSTSNANIGTITGGVTLGTAGKLNTAASFNGSTGIINGTDTNLPAGTHARTMALWAYPTALPSSGVYSQIAGYGTFSIHKAFGIQLYNGGGTQYLDYYGYSDDLQIAYTVPINSWTHLVTVYDGTTATLYVNGNAIGSAAKPNWNTTLTGNSFVMNDTKSFVGIVDDVAIWNTALSASAVATIYQHESAKYAGTFTSRVIDGLSSDSWTSFATVTTLPYGKELPDTANASPSPSPVSESPSSYSSLSANLMGPGSGTSGGIAGLWHFDEAAGTTGTNSVLDRSGFGNHGTPTSTTFGLAGKLGTAASFGGAGTISTAASSNFIGSANAPLTVSAWINPSTMSATQCANRIFNFHRGATSGTTLAICVGSTNQISFLNQANNIYYNWANSISAGQWTHVALVYTGTCFQKYYNGIADGTCITANLTAGGSYPLKIGSYDGTQDYYQGLLDESAVWTRALSSAEILEVYRRGADRVRYQIRSCPDGTCSTSPPWLGPDGTNQSYFTELNSNTVPKDAADLTASDSVTATAPTFTFANYGTPLSTNLTSNRYFQYRAIMESDDTSTGCNYGAGYTATWCSPELQTVSVGPNHYDTSNPTIVNNTGVSFATLTSLLETLGTAGCSSGTLYNLSPDGTNWYYLNGSTWSASGGTVSTATAASAITPTALSTFPQASGGASQIFFKVFLQSSGITACTINSLAIGGTQ